MHLSYIFNPNRFDRIGDPGAGHCDLQLKAKYVDAPGSISQSGRSIVRHKKEYALGGGELPKRGNIGFDEQVSETTKSVYLENKGAPIEVGSDVVPICLI